jgi:hypothetical protein
MYSDDDIQYALETTEVLLEPDRRIDTFGTTNFEFHLVTPLMDSVDKVRVRNGFVCAERPTILTPDPYDSFSHEGFSEQAQAFFEWLRRNHPGSSGEMLKYGFHFRKDRVTESLINDGFEIVRDRVLEDVRQSNNPLSAVIVGVDDAWEFCLLKFTIEMIEKSRGTNIFDFKRRGLL